MSSHIRTVLVGIGVVAICFALASLKGHHLLMAFAAAGAFGGIWSWLQHAHKPMPKQQPPAVNSGMKRSRSAGRTSGQHNNVYAFPPKSAWNISDASSS